MPDDRTPTRPGDDLASVERAIAALESQRPVLGDEVTETALLPLRERRRVLLVREGGEQRKLVTVLFADLVDFTVLSRRLDAEDTRAVVGAYFARWQHAITEQGGTVEKFIGDAVMAVFGLYRSEEDDAQRAVRAALVMTHELDSLNEEMERTYGVTLQMRVGLDTGDVVVSTLEEREAHEFVAVGPTVNRAARLQAAAPPGGVLISEDTYRQVRGRFNIEPVPGLQLKGIDEAVDAYLVASERPHGFRLDSARGVEGVDTTTVGRASQLRTLQDRLLDVVEDQRWCVMSVVGDAGVGKSRLLLDFDAWLGERPEPVWWFRGRASQATGNRPNALLHDIMASRFHIQESDPPEVVLQKFDEGFRAAVGDAQDPDSTSAAARLVAAWLGFDHDDPGSRPPPDPHSLRLQASAELASYFAALSRTAPVVVLLEDLHWADDSSLKWLDDADRVLHDCPVLVVATARPTFLQDRPHWGEGLEHHARLSLEPLSRRESRQLLQQILHRVEDPPEALVSLVVDTAEGNPFYIEELVTWLVDAGVIVRGDDVWRVVTELVETVVVPSTLRGVLQARLDSLSPGERGLLQRASVVGRVFWDDAVAHLAESAATPAAETLDVLRRRELVFEREVSAFDSAREFLFKHALLRDVAYDGVLRAHRERYHRLAALWLARVSASSGRDREYAALIADHFDRARDLEASSWYLVAGQQAAEVFALEEATKLLTRGIALAPEDRDELRFDLLAARENVRERMGDRAGQQADLEAMTELVERRPDDAARRVRLGLAQARYAFEGSEYDAVVALTAEIEELAVSAGLGEGVLEAQLWRGKALTWSEQLDAARDVLAVATDLARELVRPSFEGEALRYLALVANNEGDYSRALELTAQARRAFVEAGNSEAQTVAIAGEATTLFHLGRIDESRVLFEQLVTAFRKSGHVYGESVANGNLGSIAYAQGRLDDAARHSREALEVTRQLEALEASAANLVVLADVSANVGRLHEATAYLTEALDLARAASSAQFEGAVLARLALLALEDGDMDSALRRARDAVELSASTPSPLDRGFGTMTLGYACLAAGDDDAAETAFLAAREEFGSVDKEQSVREADVGRAEVALRRGDPAAAADLAAGVLGQLDPLNREDCVRPAEMLLAAWRVLDAVGDGRAAEVLQEGRTYLVQRAAGIADEEMRAGYLGTGPEAELLRLVDPATESGPTGDILAEDRGGR